MSWTARVTAMAYALGAFALPKLEAVPSNAPASSGDSERDVLLLQQPASRMIRIPRSTFLMGSTDDDVLAALVDCQHEPGGQRCDASLFSDEALKHRVTLSAYWLDRTEVTVADYAECATRGACRPLPYAEGAQRFERPEYPVSMVTWEEARDFCASRGARLPTEAEFERAARGVAGRTYPWGNLYNSHASNHGRLAYTTTDASDGFAELAPVGSFPAGRTPDGFLDLAGNVSEWMQDRYAPTYPDTDVVDPEGPPPESGAPLRVVRGGSFASARVHLRGAARDAAEPNTRLPSRGFRCARSAARDIRGS